MTLIKKHKIRFPWLVLVFIGLSALIISCGNSGTGIKDKIKSGAEDLGNKASQTVDKIAPKLEEELGKVGVPLTSSVVIVQGIWSEYSQDGHVIVAKLKPTSNTIANEWYIVDLYEKGVLRESKSISWNQPELNVLKEKSVRFSSREQEFDAYFMEDISHIFSVDVHE